MGYEKNNKIKVQDHNLPTEELLLVCKDQNGSINWIACIDHVSVVVEQENLEK